MSVGAAANEHQIASGAYIGILRAAPGLGG